MSEYNGLEIAIVGMSGKFPGAATVGDFWYNLEAGKSSIRFFSDKELTEAGEQSEVFTQTNYVKAKAYLEDKEHFDASFFNFTPAEARLMNPQTRIMLEQVWMAFENAGMVPGQVNPVGVFLGAANSSDWLASTYFSKDAGEIDQFVAEQLADTNFLSSIVSHALDFKGPSIFSTTACSTSMVNVHLACRSLLLSDCKVAIAGGINLRNNSKRGYLYREGMIFSKDGHCRAFDKDASGTVGGEGVGVVVLKKLSDALKDGDPIHALIKGTGINNDGKEKVGYSAPSVKGQADAILRALKWSKVAAETISYIEAHGTGTKLGDPVELAALNLAYGKKEGHSCAIGSVKSNVGHLDVAAGITGLIKTVLQLKHRKLAPSLNFQEANPEIDFEAGPFYVNKDLKTWTSEGPRRAGVSSFGIGGTNVHAILEESPPLEETTASSIGLHLLNFSAKTPRSLSDQLLNFQQFLQNYHAPSLQNIAYTLNVGRSNFPYRTSVISSSKQDAHASMAYMAEQVRKGVVPVREKPLLVFMFPGQGSQSKTMFKKLYDTEHKFRELVEECYDIAARHGLEGLKGIHLENHKSIDQTRYAQPLIFIVEVALARWLGILGIQPDVMIGHSLGELTAACVSGAIALEDALKLVIKRGELMQDMPTGDMLSVILPEEQLNDYLKGYEDISIAAINSSGAAVLSGNSESIDQVRKRLEKDQVTNTVLKTSHAFHSHLMEGAIEPFAQAFSEIEIRKMEVPFISNLTGMVITQRELSSATYWSKQIRDTVQFSKGLSHLLQTNHTTFLEVGPGKALGAFVLSHDNRGPEHRVIRLSGSKDENELKVLLEGLQSLWKEGIPIEWKQFYQSQNLRKVNIPSYSFEKLAFPVNVDINQHLTRLKTNSNYQRRPMEQWLYSATWQLSKLPMVLETPYHPPQTFLFFSDQQGFSELLGERLQTLGHQVVYVYPDTSFAKIDTYHYQINIEKAPDHNELFSVLSEQSIHPEHLVHCLGVNKEDTAPFEDKFVEASTHFLHSIIHAIRCARNLEITLNRLTVITNEIHEVLNPVPEHSIHKSLALALLKVIPQEFPGFKTKHVDIASSDWDQPQILQGIVKELRTEDGTDISYRQKNRFSKSFMKLKSTHNSSGQFKHQGTYLLIGGLGDFGFNLSKQLAQHYDAKLILTGRTSLPDSDQWESYLEDEGSDQRVCAKIQRLREISQQGGQVRYFTCNVASRIQLSDVVRQAETHFGNINGVFHAAGVSKEESHSSIMQVSELDFESHFSPKVMGLINLTNVFGDKPLDFCIVNSSLSVSLGGMGYTAYATANCVMDYYLRALKGHGLLKNWISVNFDGFSADPSSKAIHFDQLLKLIDLVLLWKEEDQIFISTTDLQQRLEHWVNQINNIQDEGISKTDETAALGKEEQALASTEKQLLLVWRRFFGRNDISVDTDFFELGGDSLRAMALIKRMQKQFNVNVEVTDFFSMPNVRDLAREIDAAIHVKKMQSGKKGAITIRI